MIVASLFYIVCWSSIPIILLMILISIILAADLAIAASVTRDDVNRQGITERGWSNLGTHWTMEMPIGRVLLGVRELWSAKG